MFNPFSKINKDDSSDAALVESLNNGDRAALEKLVLRLNKVIIRLNAFKGESKLRTWLYRIVANHAEHETTQRRVHRHCVFRLLSGDSPDAELPDSKSVPVALPILVEEA